MRLVQNTGRSKVKKNMGNKNNIYDLKPDPFFKGNVFTHFIYSDHKDLSGLNVNFEFGKWRYSDFSDYLFAWLPEFALRYSDLEVINHSNAFAFLKKAAKAVYQTDKYKNRGEFGELILHALIREIFNSQPVISKLFYKSGVNDTVKGFDAVHIVEHENNLELWLGEVKFYDNIKRAVTDVIKELYDHTQRDYLRGEFMLITGKIDNKWQYADEIKKLLHPHTNLEDVFSRLCIPVLLTYESDTVKNYQNHKEKFIELLREEIKKNHEDFEDKVKHLPLNIHLFLLPLENKATLVQCLDEKLKGLQI